MIYSIGRIKVIHFEPPPLTSPPIFHIGGEPILNNYPLENGDITPFMIQWKFRFTNVNTGKEIGGSYLIETDFSVKNDGLPHDIEKLKRLIENLYLNAEIRWQDLTPHTRLAGNTLPLIGLNTIDDCCKKIQETMM